MSKSEIVVTEGKQLPIETKLTKGEVIDLLIESMEKDLAAQIKELEQQKQDLTKVTMDQVQDLLLQGKPQFSIAQWSGSEHTVGVSVHLPKDGGRFRKQVERSKVIQEEISRLYSLQSQLSSNKQSAKNVILRRFLESTEEGREILGQISSFKVGLQTKLLAGITK